MTVRLLIVHKVTKQMGSGVGIYTALSVKWFKNKWKSQTRWKGSTRVL